MKTTVGYVTEEQFWARYGNTKHRVELVDGEVVPKYGADGPLSPTSGGHGHIVMTLVLRLGALVRARELGVVLTDPTAFVISEHPKRIRCPDIAFVSAGRVPAQMTMDAPFRVAPDFVAEVISPSEPVWSSDAKIDEYLQCGVRLVWKVDPRRRVVTVYRPGPVSTPARAGDVLTGEDVIPGFAIPIDDLFARVSWR